MHISDSVEIDLNNMAPSALHCSTERLRFYLYVKTYGFLVPQFLPQFKAFRLVTTDPMRIAQPLRASAPQRTQWLRKRGKTPHRKIPSCL